LGHLKTSVNSNSNWPDVQLTYETFAKPNLKTQGRRSWQNAYSGLVTTGRSLQEGELKLKSQDYRDPPLIDPKMFQHKSDIALMVEGR
jgi:hypothetical protein